MVQTSILGNLGAELKFQAPVISSVGNLTLFVEKLPLPVLHTFFMHNSHRHFTHGTQTRTTVTVTTVIQPPLNTRKNDTINK